jgi:FkbM family methyltransferase
MLETIELLNPRIKDKVINYGAGNNCYRTLSVLSKKHSAAEILCIADRDERKHGSFFGIPVISPDKLAGYDKNITVIISTVKHVPEIYAFLEGLGFSDFLCYEEATITAMKALPVFCPPAFAPDALMKIEFVKKCFADDLSLKVFEAKLNGIYKGDKTLLDTLITRPQYFPADIIRFGKDEVFADCGAYDGKTAVMFALLCGDFEKIYSFEPNYHMFEAIANDELMKYFPRFECIKAGVSDHAGTLSFSLGDNGSSRIDETGGVTINIIPLDEFFKDKKPPTFIKMDIEGAEMDALIGAKSIIEKSRPKLAICAYHGNEHIYEIPYWIKSNFPDYKIYMRQHELINETVCYAVTD